jgi:hypothetical protein
MGTAMSPHRHFGLSNRARPPANPGRVLKIMGLVFATVSVLSILATLLWISEPGYKKYPPKGDATAMGQR